MTGQDWGSAAATHVKRPFLPRSPAALTLLVGLVLAGALSLRLDHLTDPPLGFWPVRQYRSALIARGLFYEIDRHHPDWAGRVASENLRQQGVLEPPIVEAVAALSYKVTGSERLWVPRLTSIAFWLAAGLTLFLVARRLGSRVSSLVAVIYVLFSRYGIAMSRSFQPDVLAILCVVLAVHAIVRHHDQPGTRLWLCAAALGALAGFVKPPALLFVIPTFFFVMVSRGGMRAALGHPGLWGYAALVCAPAAAYSVLGIFVLRFLQGQAALSFQPALVMTHAFWAGWLGQIDIVVGRRVMIAALLGLAVAPPRWRPVLVGQWLGYALLGFLFAYHIHTHSYYHAPLIPIVAMSLASLVDRVLQLTSGVLRTAAAAVAVVVMLAFGARATAEHRWSNVAESWNFPDLVHAYEEIGASTGHSPRVLIVEAWPNLPLRYHGHIAGISWVAPGFHDEMPPAQKFREWYLPQSFSHIVVLDMPRLRVDAALRDFLYGTFPIVAESRESVVFNAPRYSDQPLR